MDGICNNWRFGFIIAAALAVCFGLVREVNRQVAEPYMDEVSPYGLVEKTYLPCKAICAVLRRGLVHLGSQADHSTRPLSDFYSVALFFRSSSYSIPVYF
eukprot:GHVS01076166.1.p4 GENE.GHVS01076166.1~~GHVS01076166.1.p4  ORF type:complete len:100 (+),score=7.51 GHVS01076166.1:290-589(+)